MGFLNFAVKRAIPAIGTASIASWAAITTANDDWDEITHRKQRSPHRHLLKLHRKDKVSCKP